MVRRPRPRPGSLSPRSAPRMPCAGRRLWAVRGVLRVWVRDARHVIGTRVLRPTSRATVSTRKSTWTPAPGQRWSCVDDAAVFGSGCAGSWTCDVRLQKKILAALGGVGGLDMHTVTVWAATCNGKVPEICWETFPAKFKFSSAFHNAQNGTRKAKARALQSGAQTRRAAHRRPERDCAERRTDVQKESVSNTLSRCVKWPCPADSTLHSPCRRSEKSSSVVATSTDSSEATSTHR